MASPEDYKNLINEIVAKQILILGPDIVLMKAKNVSGLRLSDRGEGLELQCEPQATLQKQKAILSLTALLR